MSGNWRLLPSKGSTDICFCGADDCITECRRNRNARWFKTWIKREVEQLGEYGGYHAVSNFQDACSSYEVKK